MKGKTVLIVNPAAGAGRSGRDWAEHRSLLQSILPEFLELHTERRGHATLLAREAVEAGAARVIAVGGDGTWHEAVQGFMAVSPSSRRGAVLGCLPTGSGCDFARHLKIPLDFGRAALRLQGGAVSLLDAVRAQISVAGGESKIVYLTNMAAFGLGGEVAAAVERSGKKAGGTLSYLLATIGALMRSRPEFFDLRLDGLPLKGPFHTVILANTSSTGGGMKIAPDADAADGRFEVVAVGAMSRISMLWKLRKVYFGTHVGTPGISYLKGERLEVDPPAGERIFPLNLDGEACGQLPAVFSIEPGALPVLI